MPHLSLLVSLPGSPVGNNRPTKCLPPQGCGDYKVPPDHFAHVHEGSTDPIGNRSGKSTQRQNELVGVRVAQ